MYAFHEGASDHRRYRAWLQATLTGDEPVAIPDLVMSGFVRVSTHPAIFSPPAPIERALEFASAVRSQPASVIIGTADRHWAIFETLCLSAGAKGNLVADAHLAALAIESGAELITTDRDFSRFAGLRWRHPLAEPEPRRP